MTDLLSFLYNLRVSTVLISRFVEICPTCQVRRGGARRTPPNLRRGSPRTEMATRAPKLPSPPTSGCEFNFISQADMGEAQSHYFNQMQDHSAWTDSHQNLQGRSDRGVVPMSGLLHSIGGTLDPFSTDLSVPPWQLTYTGRYSSGHATPTQMDYWTAWLQPEVIPGVPAENVSPELHRAISSLVG